MDNKAVVRAIQQLAAALLPKEGKFELMHDKDTNLYGVAECSSGLWGKGGIVYECDFTKPEAQILVTLLNHNESLNWNDVSGIVELFNEDNYVDWTESE